MISLLDHGRAVRKTFIDVTIRHIQSTVGPDHLARTALEMWDRSPERAQLRRLIGPSTLLIVDSGT